MIEGGALAQALHRQNANNFLELCKSCHAVVCCRVTPMQKAQVVSLVKHHGGAITLGEQLPGAPCCAHLQAMGSLKRLCSQLHSPKLLIRALCSLICTRLVLAHAAGCMSVTHEGSLLI